LYDYQSRLDLVNAKGDTLLHIAAKNNDIQMIIWLLDRGLDSTIANVMGQLPRELTNNKTIKGLLPDKSGFPQYDIYSEDGNLFTSPILNQTNLNNVSQRVTQYGNNSQAEGSMNDLRDLQGNGDERFHDENYDDGEEYNQNYDDGYQDSQMNQTMGSLEDAAAQPLPSRLNQTVNENTRGRATQQPPNKKYPVQSPPQQVSRRTMTPNRARKQRVINPPQDRMNRTYDGYEDGMTEQDDYYESQYNSRMNYSRAYSRNNGRGDVMNNSQMDKYSQNYSQMTGTMNGTMNGTIMTGTINQGYGGPRDTTNSRMQGSLPPINRGGNNRPQKQTSLNKITSREPFDPNRSYYSYLETLSQKDDKGSGLPKRNYQRDGYN
jgi:Ankyrin repeat.